MSISGLKISVSGHKISISSLQKGWSLPLEKSMKLTILPLQKGWLLPIRKIIEIDHHATPEGMAPHCYKNKAIKDGGSTAGLPPNNKQKRPPIKLIE